MSVNSLWIKLKVLGLGLAVVIGGMALLGGAHRAAAATMTQECSGDMSSANRAACLEDPRSMAYTPAYNFMSWFLNIPPEEALFAEEVPKSAKNLENPDDISTVPLPLAWPLFGAALVGIGYLGRRKKRKAIQE
ncbi:hypothetical protein [Sneathiella sp.]|uniref:hypothetical protein n=1 Tax=Sneathiella sp. TaxID=1964365 RepID=UPI0035692691